MREAALQGSAEANHACTARAAAPNSGRKPVHPVTRTFRCLPRLQADVRLLIDAEHSYFQPAIDNTVTELQRQVRCSISGAAQRWLVSWAMHVYPAGPPRWR